LAGLYRKIVVTTNLNGNWYEDFPKTVETMKRWGRRVKWNTTYHPGWMAADLYIERVRSLKAAGLRVGQCATPDTPELALETAEKLNAANIGWKLQPFTGRDETGRMRPQTWDDINRDYPMEYDPSKFIDNYGEYIRECEDASHADSHKRQRPVKCLTPRFLIGPDNMVYPCHRHLYMQDGEYACGSIRDATMNDFKFKWSRIFRRWPLMCGTKCNPCDFREVKIKPLNDKEAGEGALLNRE
ncbi:MAG: hypothetical protein V3S46_09990, partial [Nitrospinota bacterium]